LEARLRILRFFELKAVTLLPEVIVVQVGEEGAISVDREQVPEVLSILGGERIHGEV